MIIGVVGTLASGKGTVVEYLKQKGFAHYSVSAILKEILQERGLPLTRTYMSPLSDELTAKHEGGALYVSNEKAKQAGETDYILESIHRTGEADYVRSIGGVVIGVDADVQKRYERTMSRRDGEKDAVTYEQFLEHVRNEEEGKGKTSANIRAVLATADAVIMNNGSVEELQAQVDTVLASLKK